MTKERRATFRFDKAIRVQISTEGYGEIRAIARNFSAGGMMIETPMPFPIGSEVRVHFEIPDSREAITARAEVKNHYALNYCVEGATRSARGIGVRFMEFVEEVDEVLRSTITRIRTLH